MEKTENIRRRNSVSDLPDPLTSLSPESDKTSNQTGRRHSWSQRRLSVDSRDALETPSKSRRVVDEARRAARLMNDNLAAVHQFELIKVKSNAAEATAKLQADLDAEKAKLMEENREAQLVFKAMESECLRKHNALEKANTQIAELQTTASKYEKALQEIERLGAIANRATEELRESREDYSYSETRRETLAAAHDELAAELAKCKEDRDTLTATARQQASMMGGLLNQVAELRNQQSASAEAPVEAEAVIVSKEDEEALMTKPEPPAQDTLTEPEFEPELREQLFAAQKQLEQLQQLYLQQQQQQRDCKAKWEKEREAHKAEVKRATDAKAVLEIYLSHTREAQAKLQIQLDQARDDKQKAEQKMLQFGGDNEMLQMQLSQLQAKLDAMEEQPAAQPVRPASAAAVMQRKPASRAPIGTVVKPTPAKLKLLSSRSSQRAFLEICVGRRLMGVVWIELATAALPRTCKNFASLCTGDRGIGRMGRRLWYKGCTVHRVIPDFLVQAGDIIHGDGTGGESIYGQHFDDEGFLIKHDRPGVVSMANMDCYRE